MTIFPRYSLMGIVSIAIWNRQKLVIAITTVMWVANIGFFIQSKPLSCTR
jgi:hypothetical protein